MVIFGKKNIYIKKKKTYEGNDKQFYASSLMDHGTDILVDTIAHVRTLLEWNSIWMYLTPVIMSQMGP